MITDEKSLGKDVYERIFDSIHIGIAVCNTRIEALDVNLAFRQIVGIAEEDFCRNSLIDYFHVNDVSEFFAMFNKLSGGEISTGSFSVCHNCYDRDGLSAWIHITASVMKDSQDLFIITVENITDEMREKEALMNLSTIDELTGLNNRRTVIEQLEIKIARSQRSAKLVAVLFLDLNGFKEVNDTLGHHYGDILLKKVGEKLLRLVRKNDIVARYGGDEFLLVIEEINKIEDVILLATKISKCLDSRFVLNGESANVSDSIGVSIYPYCGDSAKVLIGKADMAMYECKRRGGRAFYYRCGAAMERINEILESQRREKEKSE